MIRILFFILIFFISSIGFGQQPVGDSNSRFLKPDLSENNSLDTTSRIIITDPKQGFKDLFVFKPEQDQLDEAQLNPRAISFVQDYMQRHRQGLEKLKDWGRPYFDMIDAVLTLHGLPRELKYLAVIESYLKTYAVSWAGAVGPWQFMPSTARRMGLRVNAYVDERTDYYKSTHAAARYLTELYNLYGDWLLVIAAYNGGPGNVNAAIKKSNSTDFWTLQHFLPAESRDHVKKFIATHYIMEGEGGITTLTKNETEELRLASSKNPASINLSEIEFSNSKVQSISGRYNSAIIAKHTLFSITDFNRYNPDFDKLISLNGKYELRLPADKMAMFQAKRHEILNESLQVLLDSFKESLSYPDPTQKEKKSSK